MSWSSDVLGQAFTAIGTAFTTRFLLGQFFPVVVVMASNLIIGGLYFMGLDPALAYAKDNLHLDSLATAIGVISTVACAIAFTIAPLVNGLERALEGELLWKSWREALTVRYRLKATEHSQALQGPGEAVQSLDAKCAEILEQIRQLNAPPAAPVHSSMLQGVLDWAGRVCGAPTDPVPSSPPAAAPPEVSLDTALADFEGAQEALAKAIGDMAEADIPDWGEVEKRMAAVGDGFASAKAALDAAPKDDAKTARFDRTSAAFIEQQQRAKAAVRRRYSDLASQLPLEMDPDDPRPTRFGNLRGALEAYPERVYDVDFDYLWPRLLLVIGKDDQNGALLEQGRTQIGYTLLAMLLVMLSFAGWLLILAFTDRNPLRFLLVAASAPAMYYLFYAIALAAQRNFTELAKAAFDHYRFALLKVLHAPPPEDDEAERETWRQLAALAAGYRPAPPFKFDHPATG